MTIYLVTCGHMSSSSLKRDIEQPICNSCKMKDLQHQHGDCYNCLSA